MVVAWGAICCTTPPCLAIAVKKTRATYANIMEHEAFTISIPSRDYLSKPITSAWFRGSPTTNSRRPA